mmetsp:Transcript_71992/g.165159  ORF Transcript_71992/g.165159 Transcript_71992/m.165159 type:complete len:328 (-) Transcript_71992:207-1190(-)
MPGDDGREGSELEDPPVVLELKKLDDQYLELLKEEEKVLADIQTKYEEKFFPLWKERSEILKKKSGDEAKDRTGTPGEPGFWLRVLSNSENSDVESVGEWIFDYDEPVLQYLQDMRYEWLDPLGKTGFRLIMDFAENPFFENTQLVKTYHTEVKNQFLTESEITKVSINEPIKWKPKQDVTVELVEQKAKKGGKKKKGGGGSKKVEVARPSFFRKFFRALAPGDDVPEDEMDESDDEDDMDPGEMIEMLIQDDYDAGVALRDTIIPHAVRFYTGEACNEEGDDDDDDDDDDDSDDEDEDEDSSSDDGPKGKGKGRGKGKSKAKEQVR